MAQTRCSFKLRFISPQLNELISVGTVPFQLPHSLGEQWPNWSRFKQNQFPVDFFKYGRGGANRTLSDWAPSGTEQS